MQIKDSFGNELPKDAMIIRHTEIPEFRNCPRKWFFESHNALNLEPKLNNHNLRFGSCWHKAMEYYYSGRDPVEGFNEEFADQEADIFSAIGPGMYEEEFYSKLKEEKELGHALLEIYPEWSTTQATPTDKEFEVISAEDRILVPLLDEKGNLTDVWLAAKLDTLVDKDSCLYILEHKTRGKSTSVQDSTMLPMDLQMGIQLLVLWDYSEKLTGNRKLNGAFYNLARKQKPTSRVKSPIFARHEVIRTPKELEFLRRDVYYDYFEMVHTKKLFMEYDVFPRPNQQMFGKCSWGCAFTSICEGISKGEHVASEIKRDFQEREKTIWEILKEEME